MRYKLLIWIARRYRLYAIVEDPELREIFQMLYSKVEIPSARTILRDVLEVFELSKMNLVAMLKVYISHFLNLLQLYLLSKASPGKLHIGLDGWTSPNVYSFLGIVVYMLRGKELVSVVLDFVK